MDPVADSVVGTTLFHVVEQGETVSELALRYGVGQQAIVDENHLRDADHIRTGQTLELEGGRLASDYTVLRDGEALVDIAGLIAKGQAKTLESANRHSLQSDRVLYAGDHVQVPAGIHRPVAPVRSPTRFPDMDAGARAQASLPREMPRLPDARPATRRESVPPDVGSLDRPLVTRTPKGGTGRPRPAWTPPPGIGGVDMSPHDAPPRGIAWVNMSPPPKQAESPAKPADPYAGNISRSDAIESLPEDAGYQLTPEEQDWADHVNGTHHSLKAVMKDIANIDNLRLPEEDKGPIDLTASQVFQWLSNHNPLIYALLETDRAAARREIYTSSVAQANLADFHGRMLQQVSELKGTPAEGLKLDMEPARLAIGVVFYTMLAQGKLQALDHPEGVALSGERTAQEVKEHYWRDVTKYVALNAASHKSDLMVKDGPVNQAEIDAAAAEGRLVAPKFATWANLFRKHVTELALGTAFKVSIEGVNRAASGPDKMFKYYGKGTFPDIFTALLLNSEGLMFGYYTTQLLLDGRAAQALGPDGAFCLRWTGWAMSRLFGRVSGDYLKTNPDWLQDITNFYAPDKVAENLKQVKALNAYFAQQLEVKAQDEIDRMSAAAAGKQD